MAVNPSEAIKTALPDLPFNLNTKSMQDLMAANNQALPWVKAILDADRVPVKNANILNPANQRLNTYGLVAFGLQVNPTGWQTDDGSVGETLKIWTKRMNDLFPPVRYDGTVRFHEENILGSGIDLVELRRRVGMVFQRANPFPMSIHQNVAYGPKLQGVRSKAKLEEVVEHALTRAALWTEVKDRLGKSALGLSGGQQQRLCIARALAVEPEVLLLDEPASALDPTATAKIEELLLEIKSSVTIVIVTHNMQQAARVSDRTAFLMTGRLIEEGLTRNLFTQPRERLTEDYITGRFG